jgi:hypothetical protein
MQAMIIMRLIEKPESPEGEAMVTILSTPLSPRLTFLCEFFPLSLKTLIDLTIQ